MQAISEKLYTLGRRFERLLYFGIAITAACLFNALLSSAIDERHRSEMKDALGNFAQEIEQSRPTLQSMYARSLLAKKNAERRPSVVESKDDTDAVSYESHLNLLASIAVSRLPVAEDRRKEITRSLEANVDTNLTVDENLAKVKARANPIEPVRLLGVEIPRNLKLSVIGQDLNIPIELFSHAMTVVLGPLLMIWLGSLYATRIREIYLLRTCNDMTESFPHILNQYPLRLDVPWERFRKFGVNSPRTDRYLAGGVRAAIVLVIIGPALWGYMNALFDFSGPILPPDNFPKYMGLITIVFILGGQGLALVAAEIYGSWLQIGFDVSVKDLFKKP